MIALAAMVIAAPAMVHGPGTSSVPMARPLGFGFGFGFGFGIVLVLGLGLGFGGLPAWR